ncbi:tetratricopeptide repeat protein [Streptomyces lonegramiae]|uniref:tetratricopeptide repeat protein n=1 Tax=Streptomyces lonegramiae TaxID=3075524 RepID=UPI00374E164D
MLGPEHPSTLFTHTNLAISYSHAGRVEDAIALLEPVATASERLLGAQHPDTMTAAAVLRELTREKMPRPL